MPQNSDSIYQQLTTNPEFALLFVVKSNPEQVYNNILNSNILIGPSVNEMLIALRQLIAMGEKDLVKQILTVPAELDNFSEPEYQAYLKFKNKN